MSVDCMTDGRSRCSIIPCSIRVSRLSGWSVRASNTFIASRRSSCAMARPTVHTSRGRCRNRKAMDGARAPAPTCAGGRLDRFSFLWAKDEDSSSPTPALPLGATEPPCVPRLLPSLRCFFRRCDVGQAQPQNYHDKWPNRQKLGSSVGPLWITTRNAQHPLE